ncbi:ricin-type beta-trefoil lectin domain protein [Lentzea sp. NPDC006480]|uniref:RICIN domain-containing protein n=1 Tax=Lentzea sp. NPDC006480 TaxID=3157176 RepID=UPI0033B120CF
MTDATNSTGNVEGAAVQIGTVGRDLNINYGTPPKRPLLLRVAAVVVAVVVALLVLVSNLGTARRPSDVIAAPSSTPPLASVPSTTAVPVTTQPPVVPRPQPPKPPPPTATQQPAIQQPADPKPANDGPGYLLPSDNDQKAIDFYDNEFHDAVMWDRHPPGTDPSYQPHWVREFTGADVFRIRNEQVNRCLEPVSDGRGDHVVAKVCSGAESQLWRTQNAVQFASVSFGGCLAAVDGSYNNGNWLHITNCTAGRPDQRWRVVG